jgi:peptidoglycan/xylan/chitin deacetylase (PgdA/CDA1 family)
MFPMTRPRLLGIGLIGVALAAAAALLPPAIPLSAQEVRPSRTMALTFDDLPYVTLGQSDLPQKARRATDAILRVLAAHEAPVLAFVNEHAIATYPGETGVSLLQRWVDAGGTLGNHTYAHTDFNNVTVEEFAEQIARGDHVSRRLMQARGPYQLYFRHPGTHTGDTEARKTAIEGFLASRGYTIAPHTIENSDYIFNVGYVRALTDRDEETAARLRADYVAFTIAATAFAESVAPRIFGRDIPQTLLLHANDINADTLNDLLRRLEMRGYRFITLDEAMRDAAYQTPDKLVSRSGPTWLWRWMKSKGMSVSFREDPEPPAWVMELYKQLRN